MWPGPVIETGTSGPCANDCARLMPNCFRASLCVLVCLFGKNLSEVFSVCFYSAITIRKQM